jgi:hypothetical protein
MTYDPDGQIKDVYLIRDVNWKWRQQNENANVVVFPHC